MTVELVPEEPPLDQEEVRALLIELDGNVTVAAERLNVRPERLRAYVHAVPSLRRAMDEVLDQGVDLAVAVLFEALRDSGSFQNRYYAAKEFLKSEAGRRRGFGPRENVAVEVRAGDRGGPITIKWIDPPKEG
jgi:hypothetical protein